MTIIDVPNPDALRAGVEHAELDLNRWNQNSWAQMDDVCGTTACLAGHILLAQGYEWSWLLRNQSMISGLALNVLGLEDDHQRSSFFKEIFGMVREGVANFSMEVDPVIYNGSMPLKTEPAQFKYFKKRITELTGIEL